MLLKVPVARLDRPRPTDIRHLLHTRRRDMVLATLVRLSLMVPINLEQVDDRDMPARHVIQVIQAKSSRRPRTRDRAKDIEEVDETFPRHRPWAKMSKWLMPERGTGRLEAASILLVRLRPWDATITDTIINSNTLKTITTYRLLLTTMAHRPRFHRQASAMDPRFCIIHSPRMRRGLDLVSRMAFRDQHTNLDNSSSSPRLKPFRPLHIKANVSIVPRAKGHRHLPVDYNKDNNSR